MASGFLFYLQTLILPGVAVNGDTPSCCVRPVVMVTGTLLWCDAVPAVAYLKSIHQSIFLLSFKGWRNKKLKQPHYLLCLVDRGSQGCRQGSRMAGPDSGRFWHTPARFHPNYTLHELGAESTGLTFALKNRTEVYCLDLIIPRWIGLHIVCIMRKNKSVKSKNMLTKREMYEYKLQKQMKFRIIPLDGTASS